MALGVCAVFGNADKLRVCLLFKPCYGINDGLAIEIALIAFYLAVNGINVNVIVDIVENGESAIEGVKNKVIALCDEYPIYKDAVLL